MFDKNKNFVFIGEAGCGKSELALNLAKDLAAKIAAGEIDATGVDLFDCDQTKPLFRSRDLEEEMAAAGVTVHYQDQHLDSPQAVGGIGPSMADDRRFTILDVGGDKNGAIMIGGYSGWTNNEATTAIYVVNPYRPWSKDIYAIDATLTSVLAASHIRSYHILANPNLGHDTTAAEWLEGVQKAHEMLDPYTKIEALAVSKEIAREAILGLGDGDKDLPILKIRPMIDYGL